MSLSTYRGNQFFNIRNQGDYGPDVLSGGGIKWLNEEFKYPSRGVRVMQPKNEEQDVTSDKLKLPPKYRDMKRGYIRQLKEFGLAGEDLTSLACRFQFNPQYLAQGVSFSTGAVHPMYQSPSQLNQPTALPTNMEFQIMFDRSWELNGDNGRDVVTSGDLWERNSPQHVGVFHDLSAFFRVIGQGISEETSEFLKIRAQEALSAEQLRAGQSSVTAEEDAPYQEQMTNVENFFAQEDVNVGNTAFLLPLPVRLVLSSLYMIEGTVTSTNVNFLKFNRAYVPMQASVSFSVNALYVGFAKQKTFYSIVLEDSAIARRAALEIRREEEQAAKELGRQFVKDFSMVVVRSQVLTLGSPNEDAPAEVPDLVRLVKGPAGDAIVSMKDVLDQAPVTSNNATRGGYEVRNNPLFVTGWFNGYNKPDNDGITEAFDAGDLTSIEVEMRATLYGPYTGHPEFHTVINTDAGRGSRRDPSDADEVKNDPVLSDAPKYLSRKISKRASNKEQWDSLYYDSILSGTRNPSVEKPFREWDNTAGRLPQTAGTLLPASTSPNANQYWSVLYEATVKVTYKGTEYIVNGFDWTQHTRQSTALLIGNLTLNWATLPLTEVPDVVGTQPGETTGSNESSVSTPSTGTAGTPPRPNQTAAAAAPDDVSPSGSAPGSRFS